MEHFVEARQLNPIVKIWFENAVVFLAEFDMIFVEFNLFTFDTTDLENSILLDVFMENVQGLTPPIIISWNRFVFLHVDPTHKNIHVFHLFRKVPQHMLCQRIFQSST